MSLPLITTMDHAGVCSNMSTSVGGAELYQQLQQQHQQHQQVQKDILTFTTQFFVKHEFRAEKAYCSGHQEYQIGPLNN